MRKMKLELKHLAPYLPYGVKVQYLGIINGKEISRAEKGIKEKYGEDLFVGAEHEEALKKVPLPEYGLKVGLIKKVEIYLDYWCLRVGNGHKKIYPMDFVNTDAKLILRPLSDLTDDQINELDTLHDFSNMSFMSIKLNPLRYPYVIVNKLFEWHFDVFGLIPEGLAIDINTLPQSLTGE
jgi:hypothetical protein